MLNALFSSKINKVTVNHSFLEEISFCFSFANHMNKHTASTQNSISQNQSKHLINIVKERVKKKIQC